MSKRCTTARRLQWRNQKERPGNWLEYVNRPQADAELAALRACVRRSRPFGDERWTAVTAARLGLQWTLNPRGRPPKPPSGRRVGK